MGFNFGAFIGGASKNLVSMIKQKEAELYEEQKDEKERIREARVEATRQRQADEKAAKEMLGALAFQGYPVNDAADIVKLGQVAYDRAISVGERAWQQGVPVGSLYKRAGSVDATGKALDSASDKPVGPMGFEWDNEAIKTLYGESSMPDLDIMLNSNAVEQMKLLSVGTLSEDQQKNLDGLIQQETELLSMVTKRALAEKVDNAGSGFKGITKTSDATAFENSLTKIKGQALQLKGFKVDFNEELMQQFEGRVGEGLSALYQGVISATKSWQVAQDVGDSYITNRLASEKAIVENELKNFATRSAAESAPLEIPDATQEGAFDNVKTGTPFITYQTDENTGVSIPVLGVFLNIPDMPIFIARVG